MFLSTTRAQILAITFWIAPATQAADAGKMVDGVPLVHWKDADKYYGKEVIVYGRIVQTRNIQTMAFLNFDPDFNKHFTVVVKQADFDAFPEPPENTYRNKSVAVRGTVVEYREKPEIVVKSPKQIVILPEDGGDVVAALAGNVPAGVPGASKDAVGSPSSSAGQFTIAEVNLTPVLEADRSFCENAQAATQAVALILAAGVIKTLNADLVALQWGDTLACLKRFNQLFDLGYEHVIGQEDSAGPLHCALLSRYPVSTFNRVDRFTKSKDEAVGFNRPPLHADVRLPSNEIVQVLVVSVTAKEGDVKAVERSAELRGIGRLVGELAAHRSDASIVICGGFGGNIESGLLTPLLEGAKPFNIPGYQPSGGKPADQPAIARMENFILADAGLQARYTAGSTRVIPNQTLQSPVAVSFQMGSAEAPKRQTDSPSQERTRTDGF